jgi:hypothetical protein
MNSFLLTYPTTHCQGDDLEVSEKGLLLKICQKEG